MLEFTCVTCELNYQLKKRFLEFNRIALISGRAYLQQCPAGVIFDPKIDACTTPDQSARPECAAGKVLGFECPKYDNEEYVY